MKTIVVFVNVRTLVGRAGPRRLKGRRGAIVLLSLLSFGLALGAESPRAPRVSFTGSIREIPLAAHAVPSERPQPKIVRMALTADESSAAMEFELSFRMRNFADLQGRINRREIISREEMAAKYLPLAVDYEIMAAWLTARGFTITRMDESHLGIFARGTVGQIAEVFEAAFARVAYGGAEYTSAISAPSVPAGLAPALLGISGLQPHLRMHKRGLELQPMVTITPPYTPAQMLRAYNATATNLDGAGQIIATVIDTFPNDTDLTAFWSRYNIPESLSNVTKIQVVSGVLPTPTGEETVDVEWSTAMAPGSRFRVYAVTDLTFSNLDQAYQQVYADLPTQPGLRQVMLCFGAGESYFPDAVRQSEAQYLATLASAGVTVFASSGDGGSNPDPDTFRYNANAPTQVELPTGDPSVTSVGGTSMIMDDSNGGTVTSETGWSGSGGGQSAFFSRPPWQVGLGVPTGTGRLVPDVAVSADPYLGVLIYLNGQWVQVGGTSVSAPVWTGFCALINQARAYAGQGPLGLLGPSVYPLLGQSSFRDITSGSNGAYSANTGYDMVTGLGVPNVPTLASHLVAYYAPVITSQPASQSVAVGQNAVFTVIANGSPAPVYHWQRRPAGGTSWSDLVESTTYGGTILPTLAVNSVSEAMSGDSFQCLVSNAKAIVTTSPPAFLVVAHPYLFTQLAGQAGSMGSADGTGSAARFFDPADLAADNAGYVYVADTNNDTIRKITPAGAVVTLAGLAGATGSADGSGSAARFYHPMGMAVDGAGNVYVADTANETIRKINATGVVTTVAGQARVSGHGDGSAATALFDQPSDVAVDASGNLYVADVGSSTIRKITAAGVVSTVAGLAYSTGSADGIGSAARFYSPEGVAADASGSLYVADTNNSTIRKITPAGVVSTIAGLAGSTGSTDGPSSAARFCHPSDLALDSAGNLFVADTDNCMIRRVDSAGMVSYVAGGQVVIAIVGMVSFNYPTGVTLDPFGAVYVADTNAHLIQKGLPAGAPLILTQPQSQSVTVGASVQLSVTVSGVPVPTYQWKKDGTAINGANNTTLTLNNVQTSDAGNYSVTVTNSLGSVTSSQATLTVNTVTPPPSGGSGGGGGGGAAAGWFVLSLAFLGVARWLTRAR